MAPLLPSESTAYTVTLPERSDDDRLNLTIRTGAASTYTNSTIVVHGGLITGFQLPKVTIPEIELKLEEMEEKDWNKLISNEMFYLNIITRRWARVSLEAEKVRPKPRLYHSIAFHDSSIYLFGGLVVDEEESQLVPTNDLWEFNIDKNEWICIDNGSRSGAVNRYDLSLLKVDYVSPEDGKIHPALVITGGRSDLNQELNHITVYDLDKKNYINNSQMNLNLNELSPERENSKTGVDPKNSAQESDKVKLTASSDESFIITGPSNTEGSTADDDMLFIYSPSQAAGFRNPLVSLPASPGAAGLRLSLAHTLKPSSGSVPTDLKYPSGGIFGSNILVSGNSPDKNEFQVFSFNRPSQKWTRLSIDSKKKASDIYLWKSFSWPSHHKVILLGSATIPNNIVYPTIQLFDLVVTVGLPITNIYHASAVPQMGTKKFESSTMKETTSFEAYSKYVAPSTKISSIRSVFPNFAVALGRNAFERYGSSLADFEFISADGEKVNVPIMLLRKRWGRCFDMLLSKAYARAVYKLENQQNENNHNEASETNSVASGSNTIKKSMMVFNKSSTSGRDERDIPKFRLPFQEARSTPPPSAQQSLAPNSRKASVVSSASNMSNRTNSTTGDSISMSPNLNFANLPPQTPPPTDPLPPPLDKSPRSSITPSAGSGGSASGIQPFKNGAGFSPFSNSPRGSVSGPSAMTPTSSTGQHASTSPVGKKLNDDLRTPLQNFKRRDNNSRSSSFQNNDNSSMTDNQSTLDSLGIPEPYDETKLLLEPLLTPRSLYLPFATSTVQAVAEFLFTGQLGDKWLFQPTTLDSFLLAKFYEIPLLYDLISEALYAMIGKKEDSLIKEYTSFATKYQERLKKIFKGDEFQINNFFEEHAHVKKAFIEIEGHLNTVDDGYLNVTLLRKASRASNFSDNQSSFKNSITSPKRRSSTRSRFGKSSLSKEVNMEENEDDIENENEDDAGDDDHPSSLAKISTRLSEKIKFNEDSMSSKSAKKVSSNSDYDDIDPITPLALHEKNQAQTHQPSSIKGSKESVASNYSNQDKQFRHDESYDSRSSMENNDNDNDNDNDNVDPLAKMESHISKHSSSGNRTESDNEAIQVPEGRFTLKKTDLSKVKTNDSSSDPNDQKQSTSDSDDVGVGLGLLNGAQLNQASKDGGKETPDFGDVPSDAALPTLENLASPDSPAPTDQLIQVIYEVSALACDMKLLLRAANALEMSKTFNAKKDELTTELNDHELKHEEKRLREEFLLREEEEKQRKKQHEVELTKQKEIAEQQAKEEAKRQESELKKQRKKPEELHVSDDSKAPTRTGSSANLYGKAFKNSDGSNDDDESVTSGKSRNAAGLRSAFQSFRSFSSINLTNMNGKKMAPSSSDQIEPHSSPNQSQDHHYSNPFKNSRGSKDNGSSGSSKQKGMFSSILPKRSHTSRH